MKKGLKFMETLYAKINSSGKTYYMLSLCLFFSASAFSQEEIITEEDVQEEIAEEGDVGAFGYSAELHLQGLASTGETLPFWMHHNTRGRIDEETNIAGWLSGKMNYNFSVANLELGGGLLFRDAPEDQIFVDELYAHLTTLNFYLTAGIKHQEELYDGLSASNRSILYSLNARAMPGLEFGTKRPIFLFGEHGFGIEGSWNGYLMEEDRHVEFARVHRANLLFVYRTQNNFQIKAGIHHFAQWGGNSRSDGRQPGGASDYLRVITGSSGGERAVAADEAGVLGNHMGSYELFLQKNFPNLYFEFFYNYIYEDNSKIGFSNFPDGRYGIFVDFTDRERVLDKFLYELTYTRFQSPEGFFGPSQNYFNNAVYRNGWAYHDQIIGSPFFTYDEESDRVINNKFVMHHVGISGNFSSYFKSLPYKLLLSAGRNDGTYRDRYFPNENVFYWSYEMPLLQKFVDLSLQVAGEYNSTEGPNHGIGVQLVKRF